MEGVFFGKNKSKRLWELHIKREDFNVMKPFQFNGGLWHNLVVLVIFIYSDFFYLQSSKVFYFGPWYVKALLIAKVNSKWRTYTIPVQ